MCGVGYNRLQKLVHYICGIGRDNLLALRVLMLKIYLCAVCVRNLIIAIRLEVFTAVAEGRKRSRHLYCRNALTCASDCKRRHIFIGIVQIRELEFLRCVFIAQINSHLSEKLCRNGIVGYAKCVLNSNIRIGRAGVVTVVYRTCSAVGVVVCNTVVLHLCTPGYIFFLNRRRVN